MGGGLVARSTESRTWFSSASHHMCLTLVLPLPPEKEGIDCLAIDQPAARVAPVMVCSSARDYWKQWAKREQQQMPGFGCPSRPTLPDLPSPMNSRKKQAMRYFFIIRTNNLIGDDPCFFPCLLVDEKEEPEEGIVRLIGPIQQWLVFRHTGSWSVVR